MLRTMMKSKIHRATVTDANLDYVGSLTVDADLLKAVDILPHEKVHVVNINTGARFETYAIEGKAGSGTLCANGAAARLVQRGDLVIVIAYGRLEDAEARAFVPKVAFVDSKNRVIPEEKVVAGTPRRVPAPSRG